MNEKTIVEETILEKKIFLFFIFVSAVFFFPNRGWIVTRKSSLRHVWLKHKIRLELGVVPVVPAPVVAQVSRSPQQAQLRRFLTGCTVAPLGESEAHEAGGLLGID